MRSASGHNYWNSSFIVELALQQILLSAERIFSYSLFFFVVVVVFS